MDKQVTEFIVEDFKTLLEARVIFTSGDFNMLTANEKVSYLKAAEAYGNKLLDIQYTITMKGVLDALNEASRLPEEEETPTQIEDAETNARIDAFVQRYQSYKQNRVR